MRGEETKYYSVGSNLKFIGKYMLWWMSMHWTRKIPDTLKQQQNNLILSHKNCFRLHRTGLNYWMCRNLQNRPHNQNNALHFWPQPRSWNLYFGFASKEHQMSWTNNSLPYWNDFVPSDPGWVVLRCKLSWLLSAFSPACLSHSIFFQLHNGCIWQSETTPQGLEAKLCIQ